MRPLLHLVATVLALTHAGFGKPVVTEAWLKKQADVQVERWNSATVSPLHHKGVRLIVDRAVRWWPRYEVVSATSGVPSSTIAVLHNMECGQAETNLCNGDSLRQRTWEVPEGRPPPPARPPFKWEFAACDALAYDHMGAVDWDHLGSALNAIEGYNGWGNALYHPGTPSSYIVGGTNLQRPGRFIRDHVWSSTAMSGQIGAIPIWKELQARGLLHPMR